jgi:ferredoxin
MLRVLLIRTKRGRMDRILSVFAGSRVLFVRYACVGLQCLMCVRACLVSAYECVCTRQRTYRHQMCESTMDAREKLLCVACTTIVPTAVSTQGRKTLQIAMMVVFQNGRNKGMFFNG